MPRRKAVPGTTWPEAVGALYPTKMTPVATPSAVASEKSLFCLINPPRATGNPRLRATAYLSDPRDILQTQRHAPNIRADIH